MSEDVGLSATLKRTWEMIDAGRAPAHDRAEIGPGRYELERIPNPYGHPGTWLVLKGTKIGMAEGAWRQWKNGVLGTAEGHPNFGKPIDWEEFEIVIEEQ